LRGELSRFDSGQTFTKRFKGGASGQHRFGGCAEACTLLDPRNELVVLHGFLRFLLNASSENQPSGLEKLHQFICLVCDVSVRTGLV
jgi:hypothetical protein